MSSSHSILAKLIALKVIAQSFLDNIADLIKANTKWLPAFATALVAEVETVAGNVIGKKAKTTLFQATDNLINVMAPAKKDVTSLKVQIDVNFKENPALRKVILDDLGYTSFFKQVSSRNQIALIGLLIAFNRSIETHRAAILATGTPPELIDRIEGHSEVVSLANTVQEQLKTTTKEISAEAKAELDALYNKVIGICRIAADYYKDNPLKKELFTFDKVISNLGIIPDSGTDEPPQA